MTIQVSMMTRNPNGSICVWWAIPERHDDWQILIAKDLPQAAELLSVKCGEADSAGVILEMLNKFAGVAA